MSRVELITLAITQTKPLTDKFNVIAMETKSQNIIPLNLQKGDIITPSGQVYWDIGFLTAVKGEIHLKSSKENSPYILDGTAELGENKISMLKAIFEAKSVSPQSFIDNEKNRFGIIKVKKTQDIFTREDYTGLKHYMNVDILGLQPYKNPMKILNKDYRWIHYWNWVTDNGMFEEKKKDYIKLLNNREKDLFLILYRHFYDSGPMCWIAGMHRL